ncbi:heterogeneous nuclear ribonucleoprotein F-like [Babylonia areolata]|uniref:heterogeneous nuclear ribonucleoprotein F-like n=1 Tax=Babylonia areolata TaxID=304850 RepID=UPI003FD1A4D4
MEDFVVRVRGLPWSATVPDLIKFFSESQIAGGERGVHLTYSHEGRASGEAFVEFVSDDDVEKALEKHNAHMGSRYIEVFRSKRSEMDWVVKRSGADHSKMSDACLKLRGLPFGCSKEEIAQFFSGLEIVPNGIMLPEDRLGRSTGEAFVQFASQDIAERALGKHKDRIGHRYIEIFKSCLAEANAVTGRDRGFRSMGRPGPYDRGDRYGGSSMGPGAGSMGGSYNRGRGGRNVKGFYDEEYDEYNGSGFGYGGRGRGGMRGRYADGMDDQRRGPGSQYMSKTGHSVHMRGLPFQAQEQDVFDFFSPLQPVRVNFEMGDTGRPSGEANVDFATHQEALEAMKKHKSNMQHRYIELFLNSAPSHGDSSMGGYGGSDMGSGFGGGSSMGGGGYSSNGGSYGNGGNMGGGYSSGGGSMGGFGSQSGQYGGGQQYNNNSMGSGGYGMSSSSQGDGYGGQGMNSYMGGSGSGYSSMGSGAMSNLANTNYTAF